MTDKPKSKGRSMNKLKPEDILTEELKREMFHYFGGKNRV